VIYARYFLFQLPGMFFAGVVLYALVSLEQLAPPLAGVLFGLWVLKDLLMFPVTRIAYETPHRPHGPEALLGEEAVAQDGISAEGAGEPGWVLVRGELWRASARQGTEAVARGDRVRIVEASGHVLIVEASGHVLIVEGSG